MRPLLYRGERLGELRVGHRTPGESYGRADIALLDQLAHQTAALVYGLRRDTELAQVRRESLEALAEVQTRVGRDLHDGIAPLLAGAGLSAEALRMGMGPWEPSTSEKPSSSPCGCAVRPARCVGSPTTCTSTARPTAASRPDLRTAPRDPEGAGGSGDPVSTIAADEPARDAVRQGAYLVILEAMNNVVRHARARHAQVRVNGGAEELVLEVATTASVSTNRT